MYQTHSFSYHYDKQIPLQSNMDLDTLQCPCEHEEGAHDLTSVQSWRISSMS